MGKSCLGVFLVLLLLLSTAASNGEDQSSPVPLQVKGKLLSLGTTYVVTIDGGELDAGSTVKVVAQLENRGEEPIDLTNVEIRGAFENKSIDGKTIEPNGSIALTFIAKVPNRSPKLASSWNLELAQGDRTILSVLIRYRLRGVLAFKNRQELIRYVPEQPDAVFPVPMLLNDPVKPGNIRFKLPDSFAGVKATLGEHLGQPALLLEFPVGLVTHSGLTGKITCEDPTLGRTDSLICTVKREGMLSAYPAFIRFKKSGSNGSLVAGAILKVRSSTVQKPSDSQTEISDQPPTAECSLNHVDCRIRMTKLGEGVYRADLVLSENEFKRARDSKPDGDPKLLWVVKTGDRVLLEESRVILSDEPRELNDSGEARSYLEAMHAQSSGIQRLDCLIKTEWIPEPKNDRVAPHAALFERQILDAKNARFFTATRREMYSTSDPAVTSELESAFVFDNGRCAEVMLTNRAVGGLYGMQQEYLDRFHASDIRLIGSPISYINHGSIWTRGEFNRAAAIILKSNEAKMRHVDDRTVEVQLVLEGPVQTGYLKNELIWQIDTESFLPRAFRRIITGTSNGKSERVVPVSENIEWTQVNGVPVPFRVSGEHTEHYPADNKRDGEIKQAIDIQETTIEWYSVNQELSQDRFDAQILDDRDALERMTSPVRDFESQRP